MIFTGQQLRSELEPHMTILLNSMPYRVVNNLMEKQMLSFTEAKNIHAEPTKYAMNTRLYGHILQKVTDDAAADVVKEAICHGLCRTSQVCPFSKQQQDPASDTQRDVLRLQRSRLIDDMDVLTVLDSLIEKNILDLYLCEKVEAGKTKRDKVRTLLSFISCTHSKAHETFLEILKEKNWWLFE